MVCVGVVAFTDTSGEVVLNFKFLCAKLVLLKPMESLDWNDRKLTDVTAGGSYAASTSSNIFPVLAEEVRSSSPLLGAFHVFFATRVNLRSGLAGGEPCEITLIVC